MHYKDVKRHLVPYRIFARRKTTINHAFAAAVAPCDDFAEEVVKDALRLLGQDPNKPLTCAYCDGAAETWDHVFATVKGSVFSGAGHRLGNLVPCCKPCNSKKGNRSWLTYITSRETAGASRDVRAARFERYLRQHFVEDKLPTALPE
jgi:5-methylcytosine-specific restriction endonuclease McrA